MYIPSSSIMTEPIKKWGISYVLLIMCTIGSVGLMLGADIVVDISSAFNNTWHPTKLQPVFCCDKFVSNYKQKKTLLTKIMALQSRKYFKQL